MLTRLIKDIKLEIDSQAYWVELRETKLGNSKRYFVRTFDRQLKFYGAKKSEAIAKFKAHIKELNRPKEGAPLMVRINQRALAHEDIINQHQYQGHAAVRRRLLNRYLYTTGVVQHHFHKKDLYVKFPGCEKIFYFRHTQVDFIN